MIRRSAPKRSVLRGFRGAALLVAAVVATGPMALAQGDAEKEKKDEAKPVIQPQGAQGDVDKLLDDVQKNMKRIEELLKEKNTSSSTQQVQRETMDQLDKLIEAANST